MTPGNNQDPSGLGPFLAEMRRRHVVRFALAYLAAAFVLLQLAEVVFPAFGLGETALKVMVIAVVLAFPPAVVLAWVFDLTPEGLKRTDDSLDSGAPERLALTARVTLVTVSVIVLGGLGAWLVLSGTFTGSPGGGEGGGAATLALTEYDPADPITSLAVLPLDDFSEGGGQEYFTAGMQEELITQLSQISGLRVVSRTSVARYAGGETPVPAIGRDLGVDAIIEGSVVRSGDRVRITVQLIHAPSDTHVWSQRYDRDLTDILTLQSEVAFEIVEAIQGELTAEEESRLRYAADKSVDPEAQDAYLRGKQAAALETPEGMQTALAYFQEAVEEDSTFAGAWAGLAGTRFMVSMDDPEAPEAELERAQQEALRALALDTTSVEVREVVSSIRRTMGRMHPTAPTAPEHRVVTIRGAGDSVQFDIAGMDTTWVTSVTRLGSALEARLRRLPGVDGERVAAAQEVFAARRLASDGLYSEASEVLRGVVTETPELATAWEMLLRNTVNAGNASAVVSVAESWATSGAPGAPAAADVASLQGLVGSQGTRGYWTWTLERLEGQDDASPVEQAAAHAALGRTEQALTLLEEGLRQRDRSLLSLQSDPVWDDLRADPRFQSVSRRVREFRFADPRGGGVRR